MEKGKKEKIQEWLKLNKRVSDMYFFIASSEIEGIFDDEYKNIRYLLPKTIEIENKRFKELNLTENDMGYLNYLTSITKQEELAVEQGVTPGYEKLRRNRKIKDYCLFTLDYSHKIEQEEEQEQVSFIREQAYSIATAIAEAMFGPCEVIDATPDNDISVEKFERALEVRVKANQLSIVQKYLRDQLDHEMREYLIYLKYLLISTNDYCEKLWLDSPSIILPTANVLDDFPELPRADKRTIEYQTRVDLKQHVASNIQYIGNISNFSIDTKTAAFFYYLTLLEAELISLKDQNYLYELAKIMQSYVNNGVFYTGINKYLADMVEDAKSLIRKPEETKKEGN